MSDYSVRAVISAKDDGFTRTFASALETVQALQTTLSHGLDFSRISRASQSAFAGIVSDARTAAASVTSVTDAVSQAAAQTAEITSGASAFDALATSAAGATSAVSATETAASEAGDAARGMADGAEQAVSEQENLNDSVTEATRTFPRFTDVLHGIGGGITDAWRSADSFSSKIGKLFSRPMSYAKRLESKLSSGLGFGILAGIGQKAFDTVTSAVSGFTDELSSTSAAWQTFEANASKNHGKDEIQAVKKELQDFATKTIYGASDMATTYAQLDAVGIKSAESLVKGFGGIAAAAENPAQAMKTLSQQGVQMAAKPLVAWSDFKLMLEQTPAGISAIADEMGMTTAEMVSAVQAGEIATEDFFDAIKKVGTNDEFTKMATKAKTVGQAMDGLSETVTNKILPSFEAVQQKGIDAIEAITGIVDGVDGEALASKVTAGLDVITGTLGKMKDMAKETAGVLKDELASAGIELPGIDDLKGKLDDITKKFGTANKFIQDHKKEIAGLVKILPTLIGAFSALKVAKAFGGDFVVAGSALSRFAGLFSMAASVGVSAGGKLAAVFSNLGPNLLNFASRHCPQVLTALSLLGDKFSNLGPDLLNFASRHCPKVLTALSLLGDKFSNLGPNLLNFASRHCPKVLTALSLFGDKISAVVGTVKTFAGGIVTAFTSAFPAFSSFLGTIGGIIGNVIGTAVNGGKLFASALTKMMAISLKILAPGVLAGAVLVGLGLMYKTFQTQIDDTISMVQAKGPDIITGLVNGLVSKIPDLVATGSELVGKLLDTITMLAPSLINGGINLIAALAGGVASAAPTLVPKALLVVMTLISGIVSNIPRVIAIGMQLLLGLVRGIANSMPMMLSSAGNMVGNFIKGVIQYGPMIMSTGMEIIKAIVLGIINSLPVIIEGAKQAGSWFIETIKNTDWIQLGSDIINGIVEGVKNGFGFIKDAVTEAFSDSNAGEEAGAQAQESAASGIASNSYRVEEEMGQSGSAGMDAFMASINNADYSGLMNIGTESGTSIFEGFEDGIADLPEATESVFTDVTGSVEGAGADIAGASKDITSNLNSAEKTITSNLTKTSKQAETTVRKTIQNITKTLSAGCTAAIAAANSMATGFVSAISAQSGAAYNAGSSLKNGALDGMSGGYGTAYSHGSDIGQGLVNGMRSKEGAAWSAAESLARAADQAIAARAKIGSPSKITIKYGKWIAQGLAIGIKAGKAGVAIAATKLTKLIFTRMQSASTKLYKISDLASTYIDSYKEGLDASMSTNLSKVEKIIDKYKKNIEKAVKMPVKPEKGTTTATGEVGKQIREDLNKQYKLALAQYQKQTKIAKDRIKSFQKAMTTAWTQYKKAYEAKVDSLVKAVDNKLTALADKYQEKYDELDNKRTKFREALQEHDLFATDDYGNVQFADFKGQTTQIKQLRDNINKLKKLVPDGLIEEIIGLGSVDGLAYTNELLKKSSTWIKQYGQQYTAFMNTGKSISTAHYKGAFDSIKKDYEKQLATIKKDMTAKVKVLGQDIMKGLIIGIKSQKVSLDKTSLAMANQVIKNIRSKLKIGSPSKVMIAFGRFVGKGLIKGMDAIAPAVNRVMSDLLYVPTPELAMPGGGRMYLRDDYDYSTEASYTIYVESNLDGRKVGEGTAKYVRKENERAERRENRRNGKNV